VLLRACGSLVMEERWR